VRETIGSRSAAAYIKGGIHAPLLCGKAEFYQKQGWVLVIVCVSGLPTSDLGGFYGLHIHENGQCDGNMFSGTGGHYDPDGVSHPFHAGDLPPLLACGDSAYLAVATSRFTVQEIVGKSIVIHSGVDDFHTQPAGNAGEKIACGRICKK